MGYIFYLLIAFIFNLFFGAWRINTKKFSWQWWSAIHLPIPFIIYLRITFELTLWIIPVGILLALAGQMLGGKIYENLINDKSASV